MSVIAETEKKTSTLPHEVEFSTTTVPARELSSAGPQRLQSLDAYRGLIMISLAFNGFGLAGTAKNQLEIDPASSFWQMMLHHFDHVAWVGCGYWDLIQPSFMFMVGLSLAYSYARREQMGSSYRAMFGHAVQRSLVLIVLGMFLTAGSGPTSGVSFMNVLTQMGLGYAFLFLLWRRPLGAQVGAALALLIGTWLLYVPHPGSGLDPARSQALGVPADWAQQHLTGVSAAWHKNANVGHTIDLWLLNLLPRSEAFQFNRGGYQTINFIPSLATMLFGLMCGELLRCAWSAHRKLTTLLLAGVSGLLVGLALDRAGICPLVKRIWTPSWAIFSTGWCCLILAALYGVIDVLGWRRWSFPLVVVGMNSIAIYCMHMLFPGRTASTLKNLLGPDLFKLCGDAYEPLLQACTVGLLFWLACWLMYRRKLFVRI